MSIDMCGLRFRLPAVGDARPHLHVQRQLKGSKNTRTRHTMCGRGGIKVIDHAQSQQMLLPPLAPHISSAARDEQQNGL